MATINSHKELQVALAEVCHNNLSAFARYSLEQAFPGVDGWLLLPKALADDLTLLATTTYSDAGDNLRRFSDADGRSVFAMLEGAAVLDPVVFDRDKGG